MPPDFYSGYCYDVRNSVAVCYEAYGHAVKLTCHKCLYRVSVSAGFDLRNGRVACEVVACRTDGDNVARNAVYSAAFKGLLGCGNVAVLVEKVGLARLKRGAFGVEGLDLAAGEVVYAVNVERLAVNKLGAVLGKNRYVVYKACCRVNRTV